MSAVYHKVMTIRNSRLPVGEIVNMTSNDSTRLIEASMNSHNLWATVIEVIVMISCLFYILGLACIPGFIIVVSLGSSPSLVTVFVDRGLN